MEFPSGGEEETVNDSLDLIETAVDLGGFVRFLNAAKAAGLVETLRSAGPWTVLAPTDSAFEQLPPPLQERLRGLHGNDEVRSLVAHHVLPGRLLRGDLVKLRQVATLGGLQLSVEGGPLDPRVGDGAFVHTDVPCRNGVFHALDRVLHTALEPTNS